jgi:hypothetical protein
MKRKEPTPEDLEKLKKFLMEFYNISEPMALNWIKLKHGILGVQSSIDFAKEYAKEVLKYTLEQVLEKGEATTVSNGKWVDSATDAAIYKPSITALEDTIIKDLQL